MAHVNGMLAGVYATLLVEESRIAPIPRVRAATFSMYTPQLLLR